MSKRAGSNLILAIAVLAGATAIGGCGVVTVQMTSTPDIVRSGDPVTFDITLTNQSPCPVENTVAILIPFIPQWELDAEFTGIPADAPPEILEFIQALRDFLDELCAGGTPPFPTPPAIAVAAGSRGPGLAAACQFDDDKIRCKFSMPTRGGSNGLSFTLFQGRLLCSVDDSIVNCGFEVDVPGGEAPSATTSAVVQQQLNCLTPEQLGVGVIEEELGEVGAVCFIGVFPMFEGLTGNGVANGQVTLPARGAGPMRNLVIAISPDSDEVGVCEGGSDAGEPCDLFDSGDCTGGTCSPGICVDGGTPGAGCDADGDCAGGTCEDCAVEVPPMALPIDCTTTYVSPEAVPVTSMWGLAGLALALAVAGTLWLRRRAEF